MSKKKPEEQKSFYDTLDYGKVFLNKKEVIHHFIESEYTAKEYIFQGKFYPMAHHEIKKIVKSKMLGFTENKIIKTFYHTLRLGNLYKINEINYPKLQKAASLLLPDLEASEYLICQFDRQIAYLLFGILNQQNEHICKTAYNDYCCIREFIIKILVSSLRHSFRLQFV